jgi:hypothetical protein
MVAGEFGIEELQGQGPRILEFVWIIVAEVLCPLPWPILDWSVVYHSPIWLAAGIEQISDSWVDRDIREQCAELVF